LVSTPEALMEKMDYQVTQNYLMEKTDYQVMHAIHHFTGS
jgi:hypothetical protein